MMCVNPATVEMSMRVTQGLTRDPAICHSSTHPGNRISPGRDAGIKMLSSGPPHNSQVIKAAEVLNNRAMAKDNVETPQGSHLRREIMPFSGKSGGKYHLSHARLSHTLLRVIRCVTRRNLGKRQFIWLVVPERVHNGRRGNVAGGKEQEAKR